MAATLLGGITVQATPGGIAVLGSHLYAVNASTGNLFRYSLPSLANTEGTSPWASSESGGFVIGGVTTDQAGDRVFVVETDSFPATTRIYEIDPTTSFPATKTQRATTSGERGIRIAYNPVTDSIWLVGDDLWEIPAAGGSFTAVDTTFTGVTQGPLSVDPSGNVWGAFKSGTTLIIYRWEPDGTRHTVLSETISYLTPGPGLAWTDGTFLFVYDFGVGEAWAKVTTGGTVSATDLLDGPNGPYPDLLHRFARSGGTGYVVQDANESGEVNDIFTFSAPGGWTVGRVAWGTRGAWH